MAEYDARTFHQTHVWHVSAGEQLDSIFYARRIELRLNHIVFALFATQRTLDGYRLVLRIQIVNTGRLTRWVPESLFQSCGRFQIDRLCENGGRQFIGFVAGYRSGDRWILFGCQFIRPAHLTTHHRYSDASSILLKTEKMFDKIANGGLCVMCSPSNW